MELYLIRHGQSFNNTLPDGDGRVDDPPLTEVGERQAELVAEHLRDASAKTVYAHDDREPSDGYDITHLYCSPMLRCLQTSRPIGEALGLKPEIWADAHEEGGIWLEGRDPLPGMSRSDIQSRFPDVVLSNEIKDDGWWFRPQETEDQWIARTRRVAEQLKSRGGSDDRIVIVTHGGFTKDLLSELLNGGPIEGGSFSTCNTAIGHLVFGHDSFHLTYLNRVEHLPPKWVT